MDQAGWEPWTDLPIEDVDGLDPLLLEDPVLNDFGVVLDDRGEVNVQVGSTVTQEELVDRLGVEVGLRVRAARESAPRSFAKLRAEDGPDSRQEAA